MAVLPARQDCSRQAAGSGSLGVCCNAHRLLTAAQPKAVMWPWHQRRMALARNDFFQFGRPDSMALGGAPQYALYLNGDLQFGSSGTSDTFGSPCLANSVEFEVGRVELWGLV